MGSISRGVGVPALSTAFFELVPQGGDSPSAAKAATMITDLSLAGLLGTAGQVLSVAILMTAGPHRRFDGHPHDAHMVAARRGALTASGPAISGGPSGTGAVIRAPVAGRMSANARPTRESPIRRGCADEDPSLYVD